MLRAAVATIVLLSATGAGALDLQAHRGGRGLLPENTLPAFANALRIGVTTLELDTNVTKDGVVVISHDSSLNPDITRGPDGKWLEGKGPAIHSLTFRELQAYDVGRLKPGANYGKRYPEQQAVDGTRIPRLADLFALVKKSGDTAVRFNIETKLTPGAPHETPEPEAFARALLKAVRAAGMERRVAIQSFDWRTLRVVQKEAPAIPTVYLTAQQKWLDNVEAANPEGSRWTAGVQLRDHGSVPAMVKAAGGKVWSPYFGDVDEAKVKQAKALGLQVVVWTVNDVPAMERMIALGVDGIISDRPDLLRETARRAGLALPEPAPVAP
jgi:glycerophosphoryl diester phosphodiesterase